MFADLENILEFPPPKKKLSGSVDFHCVEYLPRTSDIVDSASDKMCAVVENII
jgi:hypothetical protein